MGRHHRNPLGWKQRLAERKEWVFAEEGRPLQVVVGLLAALIVVVLGALWLIYG